MEAATGWGGSGRGERREGGGGIDRCGRRWICSGGASARNAPSSVHEPQERAASGLRQGRGADYGELQGG